MSTNEPANGRDNISFLVFDLFRYLRSEFERRVAAAGLSVTPAEARLLASVARCGSIQQNRLAALLGVSKMSLSSLLDRLEAAGLVRRSEDHQDRRAKLVEIAPAADPVLAEIRKVAERVRESAKGDIPADEWEHFRDVAERARANLRNARPSGAGK